jgi:hypothetical protein
MSQIDPWEKAAECARAIQINVDPHRKDVLTNLQQMWIVFANQSSTLTHADRAREAESIGRLHSMFGGTDGYKSLAVGAHSACTCTGEPSFPTLPGTITR